jgi:hypothetical protein
VAKPRLIKLTRYPLATPMSGSMQPRVKGWHRQVVGIAAHVENPIVTATATDAPHRERVHAAGAHVGESYWL